MFNANRAPISHHDLLYLRKDQKALPLEPGHQAVPLGASRTISEPMVCLAQTMHLFCTNTNTITDTNPRHLRVPSGASKTIFEAYGMFDTNCAPILHQD
jgi:hypothetical protein